MKRPTLLHFTAVNNTKFLAIRMSFSVEQSKQNYPPPKAQAPWKSWPQLFGRVFQVKIRLLNEQHQVIYSKITESDSFGNIDIRLATQYNSQLVTVIQVYEISYHPGLEILLGHFIPVQLSSAAKLVICDFDKTLVDTRYSTAKELFNSLRSPIHFFPTVQASVNLLKQYIEQDYTPFILSASPHFYEKAMRDWLYQHQIFTNNIFLKDYRSIFSLLEGELTTKDIKQQGFYKLNHLINILLMTDIPHELVLIGDGFESDRLIYLTLYAILVDKEDPWQVWNLIKKQEAFRLTNRQHSRFLNRVYQLKSLVNKVDKITVSIKIRCKPGEKSRLIKEPFSLSFLERNKGFINYYEA